MGLAYSIVTAENGAPVVSWEAEAVEISADEALEGSHEDRTEREQAADWLRELLSDGPIPAKDMKRNADHAGFAWRTVCRAKGALGVVSRKQAFSGHWEWQLPKSEPPAKDATEREGCPVKTVASLGDVGNLREDSGAAKIATTPQDCHINDADNFGNSGTLGGDPGVTEELLSAAATACRDLELTPAELIPEAAPEDYHDIVNSPETARAFAESLNTRRGLDS
jgi:putative DNA primase/helicase